MKVDSQLECLLPGPFEGKGINENDLFAWPLQKSWLFGLLTKFDLNRHIFLANDSIIK